MRIFFGRKVFGVSALVLNVAGSIAYGSWPAFVAPDFKFLWAQNYIDTSQCPAGQGKVRADGVINIRKNVCKTFCPDTWSWIAKSDNACHDLMGDFNFQNYAVTYYRNEDGGTSYTEVTAIYGKKDADIPFFTFTFASAPKEYWHCYVSDPVQHLISCANDT